MKSIITQIIFSGLILTNINFIYGQQDTACVGDQGHVIWYVYTGLSDDDFEDLYVDPSYPLSPSYEINLLGTESTYNFSNNYGSVMRGFIKVPVSGTYTFNVTGNSRARFFMSEDTDPATMTMMATTLGSTGKDEHYRWPEQTSADLPLVAGNYHYFEIHHTEYMYSDHSTLYWRSPLFADTIWRVINATHLYEYSCFSTCPTEGTPCDDGNVNTTNDVEDGYCNCIGEVQSANNCVGNRGDVLAMFFDSIPGSNIDNLYNAPKYPLEPDTAMEMSRLNMPYNFMDEYGTLVKGYFKVPVTGSYKFNVTGDDDTRFYLSTNDNPSNLILRSEVDGWTGRTEHYKYASQTSSSITLNKNNFYYFEMHHKEGGGGDHSNLYWKTPFRPDTNWLVIQGIFMYGYDCEAGCVPQGTACNDHDPNTENDQYDANCDCVGTPCGGPCNQGENHTATAFCAPTEQYSNHTMDSWLSCQQTTNPNTTHGNSHWIMYDFGESLKIERNRYWNYNVENETGKGAKTVIIDYSDNQSSWTNLGTFQWDEASGLNGYTGDSIPELNGIQLRYLLFTITESWNSPSCAGFSEILFDIRRCFPGGTLCDDGDPNTIGDIYDNHCNCIGIPLVVENPCDTIILNIDNVSAIPTGDYNAEDKVISMTSNVHKGNIVTFTAGNSVELNSGFEVKKGALFYASIQPCLDPLEPRPPTLIYQLKTPENADQGIKKESLRVTQLTTNKAEISFNIKKKGPVTLYVQNSNGNVIQRFENGRIIRSGQYQKRLPTARLPADIYTVVLQTKHNLLRQRLVVAELK